MRLVIFFFSDDSWFCELLHIVLLTTNHGSFSYKFRLASTTDGTAGPRNLKLFSTHSLCCLSVRSLVAVVVIKIESRCSKKAQTVLVVGKQSSCLLVPSVVGGVLAVCCKISVNTTQH